MSTQTPGIDKAYITDSIQELAELLPIRPPANASEYYAHLRAGRVKECVEGIAAYLNLPIKISLMYVRPGDVSANQFQSRDLVNTDHDGRGTDGITAQVLMPSILPLYGSDDFRKLTFTVKVSEGCAKHPKAFVAIIAHELSHVVLHSLWYADKENEIKTDLTAMLLGFADAMKDGRKVVREEVSGNQRVTHTTTYGYLSDELFEYAHKEVRYLYREEQQTLFRINRKISDIFAQLNRLQEEMQFFERGLARLDRRGIKKTTAEDGQRLVSFHDVGFLDRFKTTGASIRSRCDAIDVSQLHPHNKVGCELTEKAEDAVDVLSHDCQRLNNEMVENNRLIRKHLGVVDRVKFALGGTTSLFG